MVEASDHRSIRDDLDPGEALQLPHPLPEEVLLIVLEDGPLVHHAGHAVVEGGT